MPSAGRCRCGRGQRSPGADVGRGELICEADEALASPVICRCRSGVPSPRGGCSRRGRGEFSMYEPGPGADGAEARRVLVRMWQFVSPVGGVRRCVTCSRQRAVANVQHAADKVRKTKCSTEVQQTTYSRQRASNTVQQTTRIIQHVQQETCRGYRRPS